MKKFLVIMSMFLLLFGINSLEVSAGCVEEKIQELREMYPNGSFFTANGKSCSHGGKSTCSNCKLATILKNRHLDYYGKMNGECWTCCAYARFAFYYIFGHEATTNVTTVSLADAKPGDYIVFNNGSHYGIYISPGVVMDGNGWDSSVVGEVTQYNPYPLKNNSVYTIYRSLSYDEVNNVDVQPPTISNVAVTDITNEGYTVTCEVTDDSGVGVVYFITWTEENGTDDSDEDAENNYSKNIGKCEGNTYSFRVKTSDHNNESGKYITKIDAYDTAWNYSNITVSATVDTIAPTIENVQITDVTSEGYTVTCEITDNIGVGAVYFISWTEENGTDDSDEDAENNYSKNIGKCEGNTYSFRVKTSDHNNESGKYITRIDAYDTMWNYSSEKVNVNVDNNISLESFNLNTTTLTLPINQSYQLSIISYTPSDSTVDKTVIWSSSNETVASVQTDGTVIGNKVGTATITAEVAGKTASCVVTVKKMFSFKDVSTTSWQYTGIDYVYQKDLMTGTSAVAFCPNECLSRSQFATVLYSYAGKPDVDYDNSFSDVSDGQWYSNPVTWAANHGITSGYPNGKFGVNDAITREQFVTMLYKYAKNSHKVASKPTGNLANYSDYDQVSSWAEEALIWATQNGLMAGKPNSDGTMMLAPQGDTTRAECAAIIMQFDKKY